MRRYLDPKNLPKHLTKVFGKLGTLNLCHLLLILRFACGLSMGETCGLSPLPGLDHLNLAAAEAEVDRRSNEEVVETKSGDETKKT